MWKYLPSILATLIACGQLAKDWGAHKSTWRRVTVLTLIFVLAIVNGINIHYSEKSASERRNSDARQIAGLKEAVDTAKQAQTDNTKQFVKSFQELSGQ